MQTNDSGHVAVRLGKPESSVNLSKEWLQKLSTHLQHMWDGAAEGNQARVGYHGGNIKYMLQEAMKATSTPQQMRPSDEEIIGLANSIPNVGNNVPGNDILKFARELLAAQSGINPRT